VPSYLGLESAEQHPRFDFNRAFPWNLYQPHANR
jgi:hypothetical protein